MSLRRDAVGKGGGGSGYCQDGQARNKRVADAVCPRDVYPLQRVAERDGCYLEEIFPQSPSVLPIYAPNEPRLEQISPMYELAPTVLASIPEHPTWAPKAEVSGAAPEPWDKLSKD